MRDIDLYQQVLGLAEPWFVERVELSVPDKTVDIWVAHRPEAKWSCPQCDEAPIGYDHAPERTWRHLDTCQFQTLLHARVPRVTCPLHGVVQVAVPWAEARSRFTLLFERLIIDVLAQCQSVSGVTKLLGISWDQAWGVMRRAVVRGQARKQAKPVRHVGVDEKAFRKGQSYVTVVSDLDTSTVEHVADARKAASLAEYYQSLAPEQLAAIEAVGMDMWEPYVHATREHVPGAAAKIVFDRFHIMGHMNEAVDKVRRQEHRALMKEGLDWLKGTKYLWLYAEENIPDWRLPAFEAVRGRKLKTARAWGIKETLRSLWDYRSLGWARKFFRQWYGWAIRSRLEPVKKVARMLQRHLENVLTYCRHRITTGVAEGLNSKIMTIKRRACGFRNPENFKTAIYFYCGGLDLYPC
jgi:transposase